MGHMGKSPNMRHSEKREAEKSEKKSPKKLPYKNVKELMKKEGK